MILQVNGLQEEAEDLRKENTWKTKEVIGKEKMITELQNKLNLQKRKESKPGLLQTPARPNRRGFSGMSIPRAQQSAQRRMFFHSIMKDALPEHVKQLQANQ